MPGGVVSGRHFARTRGGGLLNRREVSRTNVPMARKSDGCAFQVRTAKQVRRNNMVNSALEESGSSTRRFAPNPESSATTVSYILPASNVQLILARLLMPHTFHETAIAEGLVGRTPWSARVPRTRFSPPVATPCRTRQAGQGAGRGRGASAPPFLPVCVHGKVCGIKPGLAAPHTRYSAWRTTLGRGKNP